MASSLFEQQTEGDTPDLFMSAGGESAKVHGALLYQLTPEIANLINAFPSWQDSCSLFFADTSPSLLPIVVELLYTGRTSLGVDQILEAHNLAKLLGLSVTLEHRSVNDDRRLQVRLEKESGGGEVCFNEDSDDQPQGGGEKHSQEQATEFRVPHPSNNSGKMVRSVVNKTPKIKSLTRAKQYERDEGWGRHNRGQRRRQDDPKFRSKTVATARASIIGSQYGNRQVVSKGGDHFDQEGIWRQGGRLPESQNGDYGQGEGKDHWASVDHNGSGLQESTLATPVGVLDGWWKCELCGDFFKNRSNLAYHLATKVHYRERLLKEFGANGSTCPKCEKVLKSQKELFKHLAAVHKEVFTYYMEDLKERGLNEEPARKGDLGESNESGDKGLSVDNGLDDDGDVEENMEPAGCESAMGASLETGEKVQTALEPSGGTRYDGPGVVVSYHAEGTYLIESMSENGQGETEDGENNAVIVSGVDSWATSSQEELLKSMGGTINAHICQFCDQGFASDRTFMSHLASVHYWERLKQEYGGDVTTCPICHKVLSRSRATLHHIAEVHKVVMEYYAENL